MLPPSMADTVPPPISHRHALMEMDYTESRMSALHKSASSPVLIQFSDDVQLAWTRRLLIEQAGFAVHTFTSRDIEKVDEELKTVPVVALFCQTIGANEAAMFSQYLQHRARSIRLIRLTSTWSQEEAVYDRVLHAPISPEDLLREFIRLRKSCEKLLVIPF